MKKLLSLVISFMLVIGMVGCSSSDTETDNNAKAKVETEKEDNVPMEYKQALKQAESYLSAMAFSKKGLYDQLTSEYGGQFTKEAAQYAIDNIEVDWKEQALKQAQSYLEAMTFSKQGLYDQLVSEYGGKFTAEEAQYAVDSIYGSSSNEKEETKKQSNSTKSTNKQTSSINQSTNNSSKKSTNTSNKQTQNNNSNKKYNNDESSTCDFCGTASNTVRWHGNYRLCHSCYQGVVNSAEGDHKLYEEDDDNYYQSDQDYEEDVEYYEDGGVKDGTALGEHPWNQDDYNEEDDD